MSLMRAKIDNGVDTKDKSVSNIEDGNVTYSSLNQIPKIKKHCHHCLVINCRLFINDK